MATLPRNRRDALATGSDRYFTGKPCSRGHLSPRYVNSYACIECTVEGNAERAARGGARKTAEKRDVSDQLSAADMSFLHHLIILGSRTAAAKIAYPHVTDHASKAAFELKRKAVQEELARLREEVRKATARTVADIDAELDGAIQHAIAVGNATAHIRCLEVRAKLFGLLVERAQISVQHSQLDLAGARERAMSVRPLRDVIDAEIVTERPMAQLPATAGGVAMPIEGTAARVAESEPIDDVLGPLLEVGGYLEPWTESDGRRLTLWADLPDAVEAPQP